MDKVTRGHYLVIGSSCADCHTPGTLYGAADTTRWLSGSELGWVGPWGTTYPRNLTPDSTGLGAWTEEQIYTTLKTGHRPDGSVLLPPMPWQNVSNYSDDDIHAIAAYLKSIPPVAHKAPDRLPPGVKPKGPAMVFPPPPAWDAKNLPPPPAGGGAPPGGPSAPKKTK
jgi:cytochrome c553